MAGKVTKKICKIISRRFFLSPPPEGGLDLATNRQGDRVPSNRRLQRPWDVIRERALSPADLFGGKTPVGARIGLLEQIYKRKSRTCTFFLSPPEGDWIKGLSI